ncbi:hypothetical protein KLEP7_gp76 [Pseudaeromonas phage vB_PpeM_ KLEP7]|nr:hypothetical protein KLEP7_gp76 [Pseudaeromonas phage vB_PpeM_ KLEP7]
MLPFSYANHVRELAHIGADDCYKLLTCKIGDLWRFVVVDKDYKNMSEVGNYYTNEKDLLVEAYDYAVNIWNRKPIGSLFLEYKKTATTEEIGAVEHAISVLGKSSSEFDEMATFYLQKLLKKLTENN